LLMTEKHTEIGEREIRNKVGPFRIQFNNAFPDHLAEYTLSYCFMRSAIAYCNYNRSVKSRLKLMIVEVKFSVDGK